MNLTLIRTEFGKDATIGKLYLNGGYYCDTLEDVVREFGKNGEGKIKHQTAIPYGSYRVIINRSVRFKRDMPLLLNVPFFEGIRIHSGNTKLNTSGCILVGKRLNDSTIIQSKPTFTRFYNDLVNWLKKSPVRIRIIDIKNLTPEEKKLFQIS